MLGLPLSAWLLFILAVGTGLAIEIAFFRAQRGRRRNDGTARPDPPSAE